MDFFGKNIDFFQFWTLFESVFGLWGTFFGRIVKTDFYASGRKLWEKWSVSKFLFTEKSFRALGKNSQDFKKNFSNRVFKSAYLRVGETKLSKTNLFRTLFLNKLVQTLGETLFKFWQKFWCMVIEAPFSLTEYRFQETFLKNKLLFNFYWFWAEYFKTVGKNLPPSLSKPQSTRLRKNFRWKKNMLIVTTWYFTSFLVFWVKIC